MNNNVHEKKILLVEDLEEFYAPIMRWLKEEDYKVRLATSRKEAQSALASDHFHMGIIDIRLVHEDKDNEDGLLLLEDIREMGLTAYFPSIILTAHGSKERVLRAFRDLGVSGFIEKETGFRRKLLDAVDDVFNNKVKIKFDLQYLGNAEQIFREVAEDVNWSMTTPPPPSVLAPQIQDVFGRLFADADRVHVSKLKPGLTGAAVVRVQPMYEKGELGRSYVAKIGRKDKVETESDRYETNVVRFLPVNTVGHMGVEYSRDIGALLYTLAENENSRLVEFDEYYYHATAEAIVESLSNLFHKTCRNWYDPRQLEMGDLPQLYFDAFRMDETKLINRIQIVLPEFDPTSEMFRFAPDGAPMRNPISWLRTYRDELVMPVHQCITHGDLTGRNIMVDETGKCWLIDFYRTYRSHILRDFIILETDIMYRLLPLVGMVEFLQMQKFLLEADRAGMLPTLPANMSSELQKAIQIVFELRKMAYLFARSLNATPESVRKEYLGSLLMGTLNAVRMRHIEEQRKLQAMHTAVLLVGEMDRLAGRTPMNAAADVVGAAGKSKPMVSMEDSGFFAPALAMATAQQRYLAEQMVAGEVMLFLGTAVPGGGPWPNEAQLAQSLMKEIDYTAVGNEKAQKLFAFYMNKLGDRETLIDKHIEYYQTATRPKLFRRIAKLNWTAVFTTLQHEFLEEAYQNTDKTCVTIEPPTLEKCENSSAVPIYKIYGTINETHRRDKIHDLPITEYDYRNRQTVAREQTYWQKIGQALDEGISILMLCATEDELMSAYGQYLPSDTSGLIWMAGGAFSEEEQDVYRNLNLRVLPDHPAELLTVLYSLLSVEGHI